VAAGDARRANRASAERRSDGLGLTLETIDTLLASTKAAALSAELLHAHSGESRRSVVLGLVVMNLVDGDGGVDDGWLDGLLLDDGLNGLVN
jgi:hypothetical protein